MPYRSSVLFCFTEQFQLFAASKVILFTLRHQAWCTSLWYKCTDDCHLFLCKLKASTTSIFSSITTHKHIMHTPHGWNIAHLTCSVTKTAHACTQEAVGGGGGGGGGYWLTSNDTRSGGGGGSGAYARSIFANASALWNVPITIGSGGTAGVGQSSNTSAVGGAGGTSSFGKQLNQIVASS